MDMWRQLGFRGFYKGFWPFGFIQGCYKGLPVLFTQSEMKYRYALWGISPYYANTFAGVTAGVVQGAMVAPTQRLKSIIGTNPKAGAVSTQMITDTIAREGISTVFRGTGVMMARRGVDWGIRFYGKGKSTQESEWHDILFLSFSLFLYAITSYINFIFAKITLIHLASSTGSLSLSL